MRALNKKRHAAAFAILSLFVSMGFLATGTVGHVSADTTSTASINAPELPYIPGWIQGNGTRFELKDSFYLNITLESSEPIRLLLQTYPETIVMQIEPVSSGASTTIAMWGFPPSTSYHKYEDNYHNHVVMTTDSKGSYAYVQDLSHPHLVFIQLVPSTKFVRDDPAGGDCSSVGSWDPSTKTCTLTADLTETLEIDSDGITLNGGGHTVVGSEPPVPPEPPFPFCDIADSLDPTSCLPPPVSLSFGVLVSGRTGITITNLNVRQFFAGIALSNSRESTIRESNVSSNSVGITIFNSSGNTVVANAASHNLVGIFLAGGNSNSITGNNVSDNILSVPELEPFGLGIGIFLAFSSDNLLQGNTVSNNNGFGILLFVQANSNEFSTNTLDSNFFGMFVQASSFNRIFNNNFLNNTVQATVGLSPGVGNAFHLDSTGGNFWSNFNTPAQGCDDVSPSDGLCDAPYFFTAGFRDDLPWTIRDGWTAGPTFSIKVTTSNLPATSFFNIQSSVQPRTCSPACETQFRGGDEVTLVFGQSRNPTIQTTLLVDDEKPVAYNRTTASIIVSSADDGKTFTFNYTQVFQVTFAITECVLPAPPIITRPQYFAPGTPATDVPPFLSPWDSLDLRTRCIFLSDDRPPSITGPTLITGTYQTQHLLSLATDEPMVMVSSIIVNPIGFDCGPTPPLLLLPPAPPPPMGVSCWYPERQNVQLTGISQATGSDGYQYFFASWAGEVTGPLNPISVTMDIPKIVLAHYVTPQRLTGPTLDSGPTSVIAGTMNAWTFHFTVTANEPLTNVKVQGGFATKLVIERVCVDGFCSGPVSRPSTLSLAGTTVKIDLSKQNNVISWMIESMDLGVSHTITLSLSGSFSSAGTAFLTGPWSAVCTSRFGTLKTPYTDRLELTVI